jgi:hypothetical protein
VGSGAIAKSWFPAARSRSILSDMARAGTASIGRDSPAEAVDLERLEQAISRPVSHRSFIGRLVDAGFSVPDILDIDLSYNFAKFGHRDQFRASGEPYFEHPRAVAWQLIETRIALDEAGFPEQARAGVTKEGLILALHHDTVEDTKLFGGEGLRGSFANEISAFRLLWTYGVDVMCGLEALTKVEASDHGLTPEEAKLASIEKVVASDPMTRRVKQSDRLHNLRTLRATPLEKQKRIAAATEEHYVPSWRRDAVGEDPGRAVSEILLGLSLRALDDLRSSWREGDAGAPKRTPDSTPEHHLDIERATAYAILEGIPGLRIVERQLVHFAYDIAAYGNTSEQDGVESGGLSFEQIKDATFDLVDEMTRRGAYDWKILAASLLRDTVEHDYIFGSDVIPDLPYEEVASRNIAKIFGSEVCALVRTQTRSVAPGDADTAARLRSAGAAGVLLHMTDAYERLKKVAENSSVDASTYLVSLEREVLPVFVEYAERESRLRPLLVCYLDKIQRLRKGL